MGSSRGRQERERLRWIKCYFSQEYSWQEDVPKMNGKLVREENVLNHRCLTLWLGSSGGERRVCSSGRQSRQLQGELSRRGTHGHSRILELERWREERWNLEFGVKFDGWQEIAERNIHRKVKSAA